MDHLVHLYTISNQGYDTPANNCTIGHSCTRLRRFERNVLACDRKSYVLSSAVASRWVQLL